jgi:hypothetical protein
VVTTIERRSSGTTASGDLRHVAQTLDEHPRSIVAGPGAREDPAQHVADPSQAPLYDAML